MKRHPALVPLSREHHQVLLLAQGLRDDGPPTLRAALPATVEARAARALEEWEARIAPHFAYEERTLLPALEGHDAALDAEVARVREEHDRIRGLVVALRAEPTADALHALGEALVAHVRAEERGLFEVAQAALGEARLADLLR